MKKILVLFLFVSQSVFSQLENHIWYFSNTNIGLLFDSATNNITVTHAHNPLNLSGVSVACNHNGNLLFYTDGINVYDKSNLLMPNGGGLNGHPNTVQSGIICPFPNHINQYFVFSNNGESPNSGSIYYSVVDMGLNGNGTIANPLGDIVSGHKNVFLTDSTTEGCYVITGASNNYWLLIPIINSTRIKLFKIDSSGISLQNSYNLGLNVGISSQIKYSYASKKLAIANMIESLPSIIVDFDNTTGSFSNPLPITGTPMGSSTNYWQGVFDCEWSSDGTKLYFTKYRMSNSGGRLYQYDIQNPNSQPIIIANLSSSSNSFLAKGLKIGPDNKIYFMYVNQSGQTRYIGVINNPNNAGSGCDYTPLGLDLGQDIGNSHKFPEFLPPNICSGYSLNNINDTFEYDCRLGPDKSYQFILDSMINNPCNEVLTIQQAHAEYGSCYVVGNSIYYNQPSNYVSNEDIAVTICNDNGNCNVAHIYIQYSYNGPQVPTIWMENDTLFTNALFSVQWFLNGNAITGANNSYYVPNISGIYTVLSTLGVCKEESSSFIYLNNQEIMMNDLINIFPNPFSDEIYIKINDDVNEYSIKIFSLLEQEVYQNTNIQSSNFKLNLKNLPEGIYYLIISSKENNVYKKIILCQK